MRESDWSSDVCSSDLAGLPLPPTVQVGIVAQCPVGPGATIDFGHFGLEARTVGNLRAGV
jgi:hypothetical protein